MASIRKSSIRSSIVKGILKAVMTYRNRRNLSIYQKRAGMEYFAEWTKISPDVRVEGVNIEGMYSEWVYSPKAVEDKAVLYLHGGGYSAGSTNTHRALAGAISESVGARVLLIEYRLCPEHVFPAALEDSLSAYHYLLKQGFKNSRIIIAGDSAGGGLSIALAMSLRDKGEPLPAGIVCISPWADLATTGESYSTRATADPMLLTTNRKKAALLYAGSESLKNPLVSPIYGNFQGLPPILIQVGSEEILYDDALLLSKRAQSGGVDVTLRVWPGMWHVWHLFGRFVPESRKAIEEIGIYTGKYFAKVM